MVMSSSRWPVNGVTRETMFVRWCYPKDVAKMREEDPSFNAHLSRRCLCIAWLRGSCPNGGRCYLVHVHPTQIVNAILVLMRMRILTGSVNKWYQESPKKFTPNDHCIPSGEALCFDFIMAGTCFKPSGRCRFLHAARKPLAGVIEPDDSPYAVSRRAGPSNSQREPCPPYSSSFYATTSEADGLSIEGLSDEKANSAPSPLPMPATYDESSASSSDLSSSEASDSETFHTPEHSPVSTMASLTLEDPSQTMLNMSASDARGLFRDFYRSGRCGRGAQCRWKHERELAALAAKVCLPKPPDNLAHPLPACPSHTTPMHDSPSLTIPASVVRPSASSTTAPVAVRKSSAANLPPFALHKPMPSPNSESNTCWTQQPSSLSNLPELAPSHTLSQGPTSSGRPPPNHVPPDVCRQYLAHGSCKTRGCVFIHSLPEPESPRTSGRPLLPGDGQLEEVVQLHPPERPVVNLMSSAGMPLSHLSPLPSSQYISSLHLFQHDQPHIHGPRCSQHPPTVIPGRRRAPQGLCDLSFNGRSCPRGAYPFRHNGLPNMPPLIVPPGRLTIAGPSHSNAGVGLHNTINAVDAHRSTARPGLSSVSSGGGDTPPRPQPPNPGGPAPAPASRPYPARSMSPAASSLSFNPRLVSVTSSSVPNEPTAGPSRESRSPPPGLPPPVQYSEEYSRDGLFTPEQAIPAVKSVASTTDRFLRDNPSLVKPSRNSRPRGPSYPPEMQHVVNDHIKIVLGPGFSVQSVTTQNETRWLVIGNLPPATTKEALMHLIGSYGTISDVQIPQASLSEGPIAIRVQMSSHAEAIAVANGLDGMTALRCKIPLSVRPTLHRAAVKSQVSDSEVRISWKLPTISLYAGFSSLEAARKAVDTADGYDWDGYWVTASIYDGFPVVGEHNVRFSGLPPDVKQKVVRNRFHCRKADLNTDKPSQALRDFGIPQVQDRVSDFGHVLDFSVTPGPYKDGIVRAWCRFESSDVASVARELNGIPQRCLDNIRLTVWRIHILKYPINRNVYSYIGEEVQNLREATHRFRRGCKLRIFDRDQWQDKVTIEISAEDNKSMQEIQSRLVDIAQGEIILDGNVPLWDRFFSTSFGTEWMNTVRRANPTVLIIIRKLQSFIRVIGAPEKRAGVIASIRAYVATLRGRPIHTIPLPGTQFGLFMHPALLAAREKHGSDNLWLDIQHRQLCVRGGEEMVKDVQAAVHAAMKVHPRHLPHNRCPVCFDVPTSPVVLSCGDTYCKDCLASYLAAGAETRQFPLTCFGADGKCKEPIPLVVARDVLPPAQWEQLIAAAFNTHIAAKPDDFRFCPTPDCPQVYRPGAKDSVYSCPACLVRICPYCDVEYHEGITCEDRTHKIDSAFDKYVRTHEVKNCPGCKAPIERAEGCNHMTCTRCHTHTCWECMETFDKGVGIYDHMREAHGSIGV